jgi:Kef-type K+ transport system membrane component KefB
MASGWAMTFGLPIEDVLVQFTVVVTATLAVQFLFEHSRLPGIVGLLLLGMLLGPGGGAVLPDEPVVELLGSIGLLYIMFLAGLEIDLDVVQRRTRDVAAFGGLAFVLSLVPAVVAGVWLGMGWAGALLLGAALSSHTLLSYPVVEKLGLVHRRAIVATIGGTLLTHTMALVLLAVVIQQPGGEDGGVFSWLTPLALLALLAAVSLVVVPRLVRRILDDRSITLAEQALLMIAVLLLLLSLAAETIGTEDILGNFLAGLCLNRIIHRRQELRHHVEFVGRMLFVPFFFVDTGMRLELQVFTGRVDTWLLAGLLLTIVVFGKAAAAWTAGAVLGYSTAARATMFGLSMPQAAATLAVMVTGREAGLIDEGLVDAIIIVIFITCLAGTLVTRFAGEPLVEEPAELSGGELPPETREDDR